MEMNWQWQTSMVNFVKEKVQADKPICKRCNLNFSRTQARSVVSAFGGGVKRSKRNLHCFHDFRYVYVRVKDNISLAQFFFNS